MHNRQTSTLLSLAIHVTLVILLFTVAVNPRGIIPAFRPTERDTKLIAPYMGSGSPVDQSMWVDNLRLATSRIP